MRTIKFRGKDRSTGKWFYRNLNVKDIFGRTCICTSDQVYLDIDPETVGQFTGLMDKNDAEIYEGDILKWSNGRSYVVKFLEGMFYASVEECNDGCFGGIPLHALTDYEDRRCEIVGNIYDNPELLKEELY